MALLAHLSFQQNDPYAPYNTYFARYTMAPDVPNRPLKKRYILLQVYSLPGIQVRTSTRYDLVPAQYIPDTAVRVLGIRILYTSTPG